jgi:hypothetical protein
MGQSSLVGNWRNVFRDGTQHQYNMDLKGSTVAIDLTFSSTEKRTPWIFGYLVTTHKKGVLRFENCTFLKLST